MKRLVWLLALCAVTGCKDTSVSQALRPAAGAEETGPRPPPTRVVGARRVLSFGDVHGDYDVTHALLLGLGVIDNDAHWAGGDLVVVQVGDQLDRGDGERAILDLFERLADEAQAAGGGFFALLGNHEVMNALLDFRYVTPGGWADFADIPHASDDALLAQYPPDQRGRVAAFRPGGPYAKRLAQRNTVMVVDRTLFVHGGLEPAHLSGSGGLAGLNGEVQRWLLGESGEVPAVVTASDGPFWSRLYAGATTGEDAACATLTEVLRAVNVDRMVVGHTVQRNGISAACDSRVWRVDVGLAAYYGGEPHALEIDAEAIRVVEPDKADGD
jgi:hypothetical protein